MKFSVVRDIFAGQKQVDLLHAFIETRNALIEVYIEALVFMGQERAGETDLGTAAANRVEHADLTGKFQRIVKDRQNRACHDPGLLRALGQRRQEDNGVRAVSAIRVKIVFDRADMRITVCIGVFGQPQTLIKILLTRFLVGTDTGKVLQSEFHVALPVIIARMCAAFGLCRRAPGYVPRSKTSARNRCSRGARPYTDD